MQKTNIGWTDYSSNPIKYRDKETGKTLFACVHASPGCIHCYAESLGLRFDKGRLFTAQNMRLVEPFVDEKELVAWMRLKGPARVFVEDMSDLFGEWVPYEMLDRIFDQMAHANNKTFQVLTKRAERMHDYLTRHRLSWARNWDSFSKHIWLGVSAEDQQRADERIPWLLKTPAAVRFVSYEPAIERVYFDRFIGQGSVVETRGLDWMIIGGESGPKRRPFDLQWAKLAASHAHALGNTAVYFKQIGALRPGEPSGDAWLDSLKEFPPDRQPGLELTT